MVVSLTVTVSWFNVTRLGSHCWTAWVIIVRDMVAVIVDATPEVDAI